MIGKALDSVVSVFSPERALRRAGARQLLRIVENTALSSYKGATSSRGHADWTPGNGSANADINYDLDALREKSRDLVRNNSYASSLVNCYVDNVVGIGIRPQCLIDYKRLGITPEQAKEFQSRAESVWERWAGQADAEGIKDIYEIQAQATRSICENGESLGLVQRINSPFREFSLAIQMIEPDRLPSTSYDTDSSYSGGIKTGEYGEPVSYRILKYHPGDTMYYQGHGSDYVDIPRYDKDGRVQVFHLYRQGRADQKRGVPLLATVMNDLKDAASYTEAELVANRVAACISVFIRRLDPSGDVLGNSEVSSTGMRLESLSPGIIGRLGPGEEPVAFNPQRPGITFEPFMRWIMKAVAASLDIPYEVLAKDYGSMNYSSARTAILDARKVFTGWQTWLSRRFLQQIWALLVEEAFLKGEFAGLGITDFYGNQFEICRAVWIAPGWEWVDPLKEVQAIKVALDANLTSLSAEHAKRGDSWEDVLRQRAREKELMDELGLTPVIPAPLTPAGEGASPTEDEPENDDDDSEPNQEPKEDGEPSTPES